MLLSTGNLTLAEASYDYIWGTGVPLHTEDALNSNHWRGTGLLGEMLMQIREDLQKTRITEHSNMEVAPGEPADQENSRTTTTGGNIAETSNVNLG